METQCQNLTEKQRNELLELLQKLEDFFYGTLGNWKTDPINFELKENTKPMCSRPYKVPKVQEEMFKKEVKSLVLIGVLGVANDSEW